MADQSALQRMFQQHGCSDFRWINPGEIVVSQWVRMKCSFGCDSYGRSASCPPNTPSVEQCREFFDEFRLGAIFRFSNRFEDPEDHHDWTRKVNLTLLALEKEVVLSGYHKAFLLFVDCCHLCKECAKSRSGCRNKKMARPSPEGMAVDVFATVQRFGFPSQALADVSHPMDQYSFLLLE